MTTTTVIRNADWVVAWSEANSSHNLRDAYDAFPGIEILSVGAHY